MPTPETESEAFETQVAIDRLARLGPALMRPADPAGSVPRVTVERLRESLSADCPLCGIGVSAGDLLVAGDSAVPGENLTEKQRRLRLGYCARKSCEATVYRLRFAPAPGLDWSRIWSEREVALLDAPTTARPAEKLTFATALSDALRPAWSRLSRPWVLAAVALALLWIGWRAGLRIPGLMKPPRVFVVPGAPASPSTRTGH